MKFIQAFVELSIAIVGSLGFAGASAYGICRLIFRCMGIRQTTN